MLKKVLLRWKVDRVDEMHSTREGMQVVWEALQRWMGVLHSDLRWTKLDSLYGGNRSSLCKRSGLVELLTYLLIHQLVVTRACTCNIPTAQLDLL
jgi:hypothetical protein